MPQDFNFFLIFGHFVLLVHFEILTRHPNYDGCHCFSEDVKRIIDKTFRGKNMV